MTTGRMWWSMVTGTSPRSGRSSTRTAPARPEASRRSRRARAAGASTRWRQFDDRIEGTKRFNDAFAVLRLELHPGSYSYRFVTPRGTVSPTAGRAFEGLAG